MQDARDAHSFSVKALIPFALVLISLLPAFAQDGELGVMYMPRPSYTASGGSNTPSPSQLVQRNQTVDRFDKSQDTYVIAVGVHRASHDLCDMPVHCLYSPP